MERVRTSLRLRVGRRLVWLRQRSSGRRRAAVAAPERDDVPIVVAGCHRSGTSLVRRILDSHSRIACPPEAQLLEPLANVLTHEFAERGFAGIGVDVDRAAAELGAVAERWLRAYAEGKGKPRWAEKSPGTVRQLPGVDRLLGGRARFLLVVRDGMDVAHSLGKGRWTVLGPLLERHGDPYVAAAHYWVDMNRRLLAFRAAVPERTFVLRYEDLVEAPEAQLQAVFAWLGEPWEPGVLDFNRHPHDAGYEDHVVSSTWKVEDNRGRHRALAAPLQARMWAVVRETMGALGYAERAYEG